MNCIKQAFLLLFGCCLSFAVYTQDSTCKVQISLITCSPGEDLYSLFGHSAIRVKDDATRSDIVYNYGTFDFDDPDFYVKFVKGKLLYFVSEERFSDFVYSYRMENRSVTEQALQLTCEEKQQLVKALQVNALEENKYYHYEFLFDNCSTRLRDVVAKNAGNDIHFKRILPEPSPTFRHMLHDYLNKGKQYWSKTGIDLLLGSRIDRKVSNEQAMFLPDYLLKGFDSAVNNQLALVADKKIVFAAVAAASVPGINENDWLHIITESTPLNISILVLLIVMALTFMKSNWSRKVLDIFDVTFFGLIGALGCLILFMWLGTDHELCADNYNILWALPIHLPMAFLLLQKKTWLKTYFRISAVFYLLLLLAWSFLPQGMNPAFLPLALMAGVRSFDRYRKQ